MSVMEGDNRKNEDRVESVKANDYEVSKEEISNNHKQPETSQDAKYQPKSNHPEGEYKHRHKHHHGKHDNEMKNNNPEKMNSMPPKKEEKSDTIKIKIPSFSGVSTNYWAISTIVLALILGFYLFNPAMFEAGNNSAMPADMITKEAAEAIVIDLFDQQGYNATLESTVVKNGLYEVNVRVQDQDVPVYLTLNGENLVPSVIPMGFALEQILAAQAQSAGQVAA
ncbi:MAG: hypothetical protein ACI83O_000714 [Patescibacteria group bacterium]|jgi:hypothetical protein